MPTVHRHHLTDDEMTRIKDAIDTATTAIDVLLGALKVTFNALLADEGTTWDAFNVGRQIDGKAYAIPNTQWVEIGDHLAKRSRELSEGAVETVNLVLDWMNLGPSSYEAVAP